MTRSASLYYHFGTVLLILASAMAVVFSVPGLAAMKMTPYLQAVTTDSVYVMAESDSREPVTVEYGTTTAYTNKVAAQIIASTTADPPTFVHKVKLTGLKPNTTYNYRVSHGGVPSANYAFITAAEPGTGFRFAWLADTRTQPTIHDEIAGRIPEHHPRFSLYGGDLCESGRVYDQWKTQFFVPNQLRLAASVPFFNAVGNHEGWDVNTKAFTQAPESASGTQEYYSFDYGDMHFLCLNTELSYAPGSPQYKFAAFDLVNTKKTWKVVFFHKPAYSLGGSGEDPGMKVMSTYIFEPCKVDVVLNGHNHFYQHNLVNGIPHMTIGSAGAPLSNPGTGSYAVKAVFDYNYAIVDVTPTTLDLTAYSGKGTALDKLSLAKTGSPDPAAKPIVLPTPPPPLPPVVTSFSTKKASWKYYATGKAPDPAWKESTFVDRDWPSGNGSLGFGESYITTKLPAGHKTYYFRKVFSLTGDHNTKFTKMTIAVNYDDGFILYMDGQEILRRGLPPGPVTADTLAVSHEGGSYEVINLSDDALVLMRSFGKGIHVLTVEVHQIDAKDGDLVWDAELLCREPAA